MSIVDIVDSTLCFGVGKVKLLTNSVVLVHILGCLDLHVQLVTIHGVGDGVTQVLDLLHPRKVSPT